ncbi:MAG: DsrE/DsrF/DrsH-like family protein [Acidimicrobiia bacterium]
MPKFDDDTDRKVSIILSKGTLDWATAMLVIGNAAVSEGIELHLFFTFYGLDAVLNKKMDHLKVTPLANPAMGMPNAIAALPGVTAMATSMMKKMMKKESVPDHRDFIQMVADAGGHLHVCRLTFDMFGYTKDDLYDEVEDVISAADFLNIADGGQIIFI